MQLHFLCHQFKNADGFAHCFLTLCHYVQNLPPVSFGFFGQRCLRFLLLVSLCLQLLKHLFDCFICGSFNSTPFPLCPRCKERIAIVFSLESIVITWIFFLWVKLAGR